MGETFNEAFSRATTSAVPPIRGRTMKDYEEKQAQLKKENFNLKLRIYFLEERMGQINGLKDKEEAIKKNIELKVENESMRKELSEKQELLCQAAKALDFLEDQRKDEKLRSVKECSTLENRIQELEKELQESASAQQVKFSAMTQSTDSQYSSACFEVDQLTAQIQEMQEQSREDREKISLLETELQSTRHQCETLQTSVTTQNAIILKLEEAVGVKQSDLCNRVQKLLDCEKLVSEMQELLTAQEKTMQEREARHSKVKVNAQNYKANLNTSNLELQRLREEVKNLKKQRNDEARKGPSICSECIKTGAANQDLVEKLEAKNKELEMKNESFERNALMMRELISDVNKLNAENKAKDVKLSEFSQKLSAKDLKIAGLDQKLRIVKNEDASAENISSEDFNQDRECRLQSIQASLREKESQLVACEQRLEARDNRIQELELEIQSLRKEYLHMSDEKPLLNDEHDNKESSCNISSHESILSKLADKDKEIENLNMKLRKRTFNLQELVNKELWDKNKQIERLELRLTAQGALCDRKELDLKEAMRKLSELGVTVTSLTQNNSEVTMDNVSDLQEQLKISLEEQKYLSREVDSLKERLRNTPERDSESIRLRNLVMDNQRLQEVEEHHRLWRREASKALSVLRTRLEELAIFLDELLHQPALVVGLCADRQRVLRAAINGSLELSRTIANLSSESVPEDSTSPLKCNETNGSLCVFSHEDADFASHHLDSDMKGTKSLIDVQDSQRSPRTVRSCKPFERKENGFGVQAEEDPHSEYDNVCDKQEIEDLHNSSSLVHTTTHKTSGVTQIRRRSRSHPQGTGLAKTKGLALNPNTGSQSDSEAWSEPDRSVSQARMGIHNESSQTISSVASTVRRISLGGQSSSSDSQNDHTKSLRRESINEASNADDNKLATRTHCLEKLNQALELQIGLPSSGLRPETRNEENAANESAIGSNNLWNQLNWERNARNAWQKCAATRLHQLQVLSKANNDLSEKVMLQETEKKDRQAELLDMKFALVEMSENAEEKHNLSAQTMQGLEEKIQELSVQVLEVEVRREQAEQDAQQALCLQKDLQEKLTIAEKDLDESRKEATTLQVSVKHLLSKRYELEKEAKQWKDKAQELEKELEKWKRVVQKCEVEIKEVHAQLAHKFTEKLLMLEQLKCAAEQRAEDWIAKFNEAQAKSVEVDRRAKEKVRLMEEQLKLKNAEIERRSEELQEKLKREAEIRASRKLELIVEQRMKEYDAESRAAADVRVRDIETAFKSQLGELERKAAADAEKLVLDLEERHKIKENELREKLAENEGEGEIQRRLNNVSVAASQAQLETARLANEKLQLEQQVRWLQAEAMRDGKQLHDQLSHKIFTLTQANLELQKHIRELERDVLLKRRKGSGTGSSSSDGKVLSEITNLKNCATDVSNYVSEQEEHVYPLQDTKHHCWYRELPQSPPAVVLTAEGNTVSVGNGPGRLTTASPDLGIESDQGRFSSLEPFPLKKSTTAPALARANDLTAAFQLKKKQQLDYRGLEQENLELKQRLQHTRQTLEQTYAQLAAANQRKRLVEKAICKQLNKTHYILRKARDNFETNPSPAPEPEDSIQRTD